MKLRSPTLALLLYALTLLVPASPARGQAWDAVQFFRYDIERVIVAPTVPGTWNVKVVFSVANPVWGSTWNIRNDLPFTSAGASLTLDIGWDATAFTNAGSANALLGPVLTKLLGTGTAMPVQVRGLQGSSGVATPCNLDPSQCPGIPDLTNRFWVARDVTPVNFIVPVRTGRVAIEGKPVCNGIASLTCPAPSPGYANVPVRSAVASFAFTATESIAALINDPRAPVVDFAKCSRCHDGKVHGTGIVPRLSLHGNNRTENLGLCVMCHNANQTDVPYRYLTAGTSADPRIAGPEVPIDFKVLVHSIHSGGFRRNPFVVVGFGSSVNDFSGVRFPADLANCLNCHVETGGKGSFELPVKSTLGTTVNSQSTYLVAPGSMRSINVNPFTHLKMTPTAAACSACHDSREVKSHMVKTGGASFSTLQQTIGSTVNERCANCHGPGKDKDVRKVHEIGSGDASGGTTSSTTSSHHDEEERD